MINKIRVKIDFDQNGVAIHPGLMNRDYRDKFKQLKRVRVVHHSDTFILPDTFVIDGQRHGDLAEVEKMVRENRYGNGE